MHCLGLRADNVEVIPERHWGLSVDIPPTGKGTAAAISQLVRIRAFRTACRRASATLEPDANSQEEP